MKIWKEKRGTKYIWRGDATIAGRRHRPTGDSKGEIEDIFASLRRRAREEKYDLPGERVRATLRDLVAARKSAYDFTDGTQRHRFSLLEAFRDQLGPDTHVETLTTAHIHSFVETLRRRGLMPTSINAYLQHLAAMLHAGELYFPALQAWKCPRIPYERVSRTEAERARTIETDELQKLLPVLRAERQHHEPFLATLNRHTVADLLQADLMIGFRISELRTLRRAHVNFSTNMISTVASKTGGRIEAEMSPTLRRIMLRRWEVSTSDWLFPNAHGTGPIERQQVYATLARAAVKAGVSYGRKDGFTFHDARRTAITEMIENNIPIPTIQARTGQTRERVLQYAQVRKDSRARSARVLERRFWDALDKTSTESTRRKRKVSGGNT